MKVASVRKHALSLPEVTEEPHFQYSSFRVRGKIFLTFPPDETAIHVFVGEQQREFALAIHSHFVEKLLWGGKVVGLRVSLRSAVPAPVKQLITQAWENKAPKSVHAQADKAAARRKS